MTLEARVAQLAGSDVARITPFHGGDLSDVYDVTLEDGRRVVAKTGPHVSAEAGMLRQMIRAGAKVPIVLAQGGSLMLIEHLDERPPTEAGWAALGHTLAALHGTTGSRYGWDEDYAFGRVHIVNDWQGNWVEFWASQRLLDGRNELPTSLVARLDCLATRLPDLIPTCPQAALLHGDLWTGNALFMGDRAAMIDPACYFGHAEVDLAMLTLFGTPHAAFWEGYGALEDGIEARRPAYLLWPALVHLRL
ncbi:MAG: fructosamine kinase family protein, partial [Brevirhabdus sp.]